MDNGSIIGKNNTTSKADANGIWNIFDVYVGRRRNLWPSTGILSYTSILGDNGVWPGGSLIFDTHDEYVITPFEDIGVLVKMWGAGGACGFDYTQGITSTSRQGPGGGGGYSTAQITLRAGTTYYFQIGQGGIRTTSLSPGATYIAGGIQSTSGGTQGGGYTGIFKTSVSQSNALLIAGGGGGGSDTSFAAYGGAGGGTSGQSAPGSQQSGSGGTQTAGGSPSIYDGCTPGSALRGGGGRDTDNHAGLGGGGGGYFGGGGGNVGGGGGGSGFVSNDSDVSSGSTLTGNAQTPANSTDVDKGSAGQGGIAGSTSGTNGKIIITQL